MTSRIRDELRAIQPHDDLEREHLTDAFAWVESGADLCRLAKPATPPKHLVAYFSVVDDGHVLLVDHRNAELWLPPGGHVEPDEDPRATVVRELHEELSLLVAPIDVGAPLMVTVTSTVGHTAGHTDVSLWYVVAGSRQQSIDFDAAEFHSVRWFPYDQVPLERSDPHLGRFLAKLAGPMRTA